MLAPLLLASGLFCHPQAISFGQRRSSDASCTILCISTAVQCPRFKVRLRGSPGAGSCADAGDACLRLYYASTQSESRGG
jgi:hypothetical protein